MAGAFSWTDPPRMGLRSRLWNAGFNATLAVASYDALRALHAALPEADRRRYNWLTAPFYPSEFVLIFTRR